MLIGVCALLAGSALLRADVNHNLPAGQYMLSAQGGGSETIGQSDDGHFDIVGLVALNGSGGASAINLTLAYQDEDESYVGFTCNLITPSDVLYTMNTSTGIGTLALSIGNADTCDLGDHSGPANSETGTSITFNMYAANGQARVVSTASTFVDPVETYETINSPSVGGTLVPSRSSIPAGPVLIDGTGQATDSYQDFGHISVAGIANLNGKGAASTLDLTLVYSDNDDPRDAFTCRFTTASDLSYTMTGLVGNLTLTVGPNDVCYQTANPASPVPNTGNSMTFNFYENFPESEIVSTASTLDDGFGHQLSDPGLVATIIPAYSCSNHVWSGGTYLLAAQGGAAESGSGFDDGHMDLAGEVTINGSGASALNVTLAYQDFHQSYDGFTCVLKTPSDLTYNLNSSSGVGTLTLTVDPLDSCFEGDNPAVPVNEAGKSITFNLYASANQARVASVASNLVSAFKQQTLIAPSVAGSFTPAVPALAASTALVEGFGQSTSTNPAFGEIGHLAIGGIANLNSAGGANSLDLTLVYSDLHFDEDGFTCRFTTASDLSYTLAGHVGTLTLTVGPNDVCYETGDPTIPVPNQGHSITFNYYGGYKQSEIVSTASNLLDGLGDIVIDPGLTAILEPQSFR